MTRILHTIKVLSFWGICFLIILTIGFKVSIQDILSIALLRQMPLSIVCIYLLLSVILFPVLFLITNMDCIFVYRFPIIVTIAMELQADLWVPYKGFDLRHFLYFKEYGSWKMIFHDIALSVFRIIEMITWWGIVVFGSYYILNQSPNAITDSFQSKSTSERFLVIFAAIGVYVLLNIISWILNIISDRIMESFELPYESPQDSKTHHNHREPKKFLLHVELAGDHILIVSQVANCSMNSKCKELKTTKYLSWK